MGLGSPDISISELIKLNKGNVGDTSQDMINKLLSVNLNQSPLHESHKEGLSPGKYYFLDREDGKLIYQYDFFNQYDFLEDVFDLPDSWEDLPNYFENLFSEEVCKHQRAAISKDIWITEDITEDGEADTLKLYTVLYADKNTNIPNAIERKADTNGDGDLDEYRYFDFEKIYNPKTKTYDLHLSKQAVVFDSDADDSLLKTWTTFVDDNTLNNLDPDDDLFSSDQESTTRNNFSGTENSTTYGYDDFLFTPDQIESMLKDDLSVSISLVND